MRLHVQAPEAAAAAPVVGQLADSYRSFQADLSAQLAKQHPELSEALCLEVLRRQLSLSNAASQHHVRPAFLTCRPEHREIVCVASQRQCHQHSQLVRHRCVSFAVVCCGRRSTFE